MINLKNVMIFDHPIINHKLAIIRNKNTSTKEFADNVSDIASLMTYEIFKDLDTKDVSIETPICNTSCKMISNDIVLVPILRAGMGMLEGFKNVLPSYQVGFVGMYRDETTKEPKDYYSKLPEDLASKRVIILDPMLATGGSACDAISLVKKLGAKNIKFACIVSAPQGIKKVNKLHPDVKIFAATLDEKLNEKAYIVPGLGDCGDRLFGTDK